MQSTVTQCSRYLHWLQWISLIDHLINSLWPSDSVWHRRFWSTLAQVMAWCLMAPSHYLNQYWLIISEVLWNSPEGNFKENAQNIYPWYESENIISGDTGSISWLLMPWPLVSTGHQLPWYWLCRLNVTSSSMTKDFNDLYYLIVKKW